MVKLRVIGTVAVALAVAILTYDQDTVPRWARVAAAIVISAAGALGVPAAKSLTRRAFVADHADPVGAAREAVNGAADR